MQNNIEKKNLSAFSSEGLVGQLVVTFVRDQSLNSGVKISVKGLIDEVFIGSDFYDVFLKLRKVLEEKFNAVLGCKGCLKQAHISGLSRDWSRGLSVYLTDEKTLKNQQVCIFDEIDLDQVNDLLTISNQDKYRKKFKAENKDRYIEYVKKLESEAQLKEIEDFRNGKSWRNLKQ